MSSARESAARVVDSRRARAAGEPSALAELGKRFAQFRKEHPRGTRVPDELRTAALACLREVAPAEVYRTCGISFAQVMAWKGAAAQRREAPDVRVFSVVDEEAAPCLAPRVTASVAAPALELRLGPWSVSVRLAGPTGRG